MKRVLCFWMVLYITLAVLHPCADALLCTIAESHAESEDHQEDNCSPFCVCACCGVSFIPQKLIAFYTFFNIITQSDFLYLVAFGQNFNPSFWQPPRIPAFTLNSYLSL